MKRFFNEMLDAMSDGGKVIAAVVGYLIGVFVVLSFVGCSSSKKVDIESHGEYYEQRDLERAIEEMNRRYSRGDTAWLDGSYFGLTFTSTKYDPETGAVTQVDSASMTGGFFAVALLPKRLRWRKREWTRLSKRMRYTPRLTSTSLTWRRSLCRGRVLPFHSRSGQLLFWA